MDENQKPSVATASQSPVVKPASARDEARKFADEVRRELDASETASDPEPAHAALDELVALVERMEEKMWAALNQRIDGFALVKPALTPRSAEAWQAMFADFYNCVDRAEKIDTNAGDSAVSVALWSWGQLYAEATRRA